MGVKELFPHQKEAVSALDKHYKDDCKSYSGLVVIPTGGGKTFTAITWINKNFNCDNTKIIWFAQSFELLNQADATFETINDTIKKRVISSNKFHDRVDQIVVDDELLIITTQTAMGALKQDDNKFVGFIDNNKSNKFIIVLDEAHHAPALGCRKMLTDLFERLKCVWMLGLTATPTYTDRSKRGWLWEIFYDGIIYNIEKKLLQQQRILARENIIKRKTPHRVELSDKDFNRLIRYNSDIPENIIEELASNQERNNFILNEFISNMEYYGKTIIFLDRWYQCIYFKEKLNDNGISAEAIYYQNENKEDELKTNKGIIDRFRNGKIDVLLNIKMMTEGADVPDIKTVFITRDTTSHILLQQMVGRALRGERAGGKKERANIVLFGDNWNKTIAWAQPDMDGGIEENRVNYSSTPFEKISVDLISNVVKNMTFQITEISSFINLIPIGWYITEVVTFGENERIEIKKDSVLVYDNTKEKWSKLLEEIGSLKNFWANETIDDKEAKKFVGVFTKKYFPQEKRNAELDNGIINVLRHIAQNNEQPPFYEFVDRKNCNIESIAVSAIEMNPVVQYRYLMDEYTQAGNIWSYLYENFYFFKVSVDMYINRILFNMQNDDMAQYNEKIIEKHQINEAQEKEIIKAVKFRDSNCCVCCGLTSKETKLVVSDILNYNMGKSRSINRMQTLCSRCNIINNRKKVNYKSNKSVLVASNKFEGVNFDEKYFKNISRIKATIRASVNLFYECNAVFDVNISRRKSSPNYKQWDILLYSENNIEWLSLQINQVLSYVVHDLKQEHVKRIVLIKIS